MRIPEIKARLDKIIQHFLTIHPVNLDYSNLNKMKRINFLLASETYTACTTEYKIKADLKNYFSDILLASNQSLRAIVKVVFQAELITSQAAELIIANILLDDYSTLIQSPPTDEQHDKIKAVIAQNTEIKEKYSVFNTDIQHKLSILGNLCNTALNPWQKRVTKKFQQYIDTNAIQNFNDYEKLINNFLFFLLEESACFLPSHYSTMAEEDFAHEKNNNHTIKRLSDNDSLDLDIDEINHFIASYEDYSQDNETFTHQDASIRKTEQTRLLFALLDKIKTNKSFRSSIEHLVSELLPKEAMEEEGESTTAARPDETLSTIQNTFNKTLWELRKQCYCIQSSAQLTGTLPQLLIIHVAQTHAGDINKITSIKEALSLFSTPNYNEEDGKVVVLVSSEQEPDRLSKASSIFSSRESLHNSLSSSPRDSLTSSSPRFTYSAHYRMRHPKTSMRHSNTSSSLGSSDPEENHKALKEKEDIVYRTPTSPTVTAINTQMESHLKQRHSTPSTLQRTHKQSITYTSAATAAASGGTIFSSRKEEATSSSEESLSSSLEKVETKPYFYGESIPKIITDGATSRATSDTDEETTPPKNRSHFREKGRLGMLFQEREKQSSEDKKSIVSNHSIIELTL
jgi:hypothetical protein